jgi:hypothetical protein
LAALARKKSPHKGKNFDHLSQLQQAVFDALKTIAQESVASLTGYSFILDALSI